VSVRVIQSCVSVNECVTLIHMTSGRVIAMKAMRMTVYHCDPMMPNKPARTKPPFSGLKSKSQLQNRSLYSHSVSMCVQSSALSYNAYECSAIHSAARTDRGCVDGGVLAAPFDRRHFAL
jgi:hypothetical protein